MQVNYLIWFRFGLDRAGADWIVQGLVPLFPDWYGFGNSWFKVFGATILIWIQVLAWVGIVQGLVPLYIDLGRLESYSVCVIAVLTIRFDLIDIKMQVDLIVCLFH